MLGGNGLVCAVAMSSISGFCPGFTPLWCTLGSSPWDSNRKLISSRSVVSFPWPGKCGFSVVEMPTADHSSPPLVNYAHQVFPANPGEQIHVCNSSRMQNQTADLGTMQLIESRSLFSMSGTHCMLNINVTCNQTNRFITNQIRGVASC